MLQEIPGGLALDAERERPAEVPPRSALVPAVSCPRGDITGGDVGGEEACAQILSGCRRGAQYVCRAGCPDRVVLHDEEPGSRGPPEEVREGLPPVVEAAKRGGVIARGGPLVIWARDLIPGARLVEVNGSGHYVQEEQPAAVAAAMIAEAPNWL